MPSIKDLPVEVVEKIVESLVEIDQASIPIIGDNALWTTPDLPNIEDQTNSVVPADNPTYFPLKSFRA